MKLTIVQKLIISFFAVVAFITIIVSCKKLDESIRPKKPEMSSSITKKFFTVPESADEKVKAIAKSIERQNEQRKFVEGLVKRVGYPHWDKAMIASKMVLMQE